MAEYEKITLEKYHSKTGFIIDTAEIYQPKGDGTQFGYVLSIMEYQYLFNETGKLIDTTHITKENEKETP